MVALSKLVQDEYSEDTGTFTVRGGREFPWQYNQGAQPLVSAKSVRGIILRPPYSLDGIRHVPINAVDMRIQADHNLMQGVIDKITRHLPDAVPWWSDVSHMAVGLTGDPQHRFNSRGEELRKMHKSGALPKHVAMA